MTGSSSLRSARVARLGDMVPPLWQRHVLVVGCGSVGSTMVDVLARHGVGGFTLVDPDRVDATNLSRSVYRHVDIGRAKVDALADHLTSIDPGIKVTRIEGSLSDFSEMDQAENIGATDFAVIATDDPVTQAALNHRCYALCVPAVFPALYRAAAAGEIILTVAEATPCWACATGSRVSQSHSGEKNYGTGRLHGETALGADILTVVAVAAKHAIGLLAGPATPAGQQTLTAIARHSMCILATTPQWDWFPDTFSDTAGQYAPQSIWLTVTGSPDCPVCGTNRQAPLPPLDVTGLDQ